MAGPDVKFGFGEKSTRGHREIKNCQSDTSSHRQDDFAFVPKSQAENTTSKSI
jgi:hypothetical protein